MSGSMCGSWGAVVGREEERQEGVCSALKGIERNWPAEIGKHTHEHKQSFCRDPLSTEKKGLAKWQLVHNRSKTINYLGTEPTKIV